MNDDEKKVDNESAVFYTVYNDYLRALIKLSEENTPANKANADDAGKTWEKLADEQ